MQSCFPACSHGEYVRLTGLAVSHIQCTKTCKKVKFLTMESVTHLAEYVAEDLENDTFEETKLVLCPDWSLFFNGKDPQSGLDVIYFSVYCTRLLA